MLSAPNLTTIQRILLNNWKRVEKFIKDYPDWLPHKDSVLGCGHYGCVLSTDDQNVVVKVTSDKSEIDFVDEIIDIEAFPSGIVKYYELLRLSDTYLKRPVALIWREAAYNVGQLYKFYNPWNIYDPRGDAFKTDQHKERIWNEFLSYMTRYNTCAHYLREYFLRGKTYHDFERYGEWAWNNITYDNIRSQEVYNLKGDQKAAACFRGVEISIEMLKYDSEVGYLIGEALEFYFDRGYILADVHTGNLGQVYRPGYSNMVNVITDPGHIVKYK